MTTGSGIAVIVGVIVGRSVVAALVTLVVVTVSAMGLSISIVLRSRVTVLSGRLIEALRSPVVVARFVVVVRRGAVGRLSVVATGNVVIEGRRVITVASTIKVVLRRSVVGGLILVAAGLKGRRSTVTLHSPPSSRAACGTGSKALLPRHFTAHNILSSVQNLSSGLQSKMDERIARDSQSAANVPHACLVAG